MRNRWRRFSSTLVVLLCGLSVVLALIPLALILFYVVSQGITSLNAAFFTQMPRPVGEAGGGMANAIVGSLMVTGLGALFAIPVGVMAGIYASEYAASPRSSGSPPTRSTASPRS
jgi:phosphate transport system permease protein